MSTIIKCIWGILLLVALPVQTAKAQKFAISGSIKEYFTYNRINDTVWVTTMTVDSTAVDRRAYVAPSGPMRIFARVNKSGTYILKFSAEGFIDTYIKKHFAFRSHRMEYIDIGNVFMQKRPRKEIQLGEATVKATKLMMVMKGDTLVYNADAFQLAEGSMLDKLISMLPGVELKKDGVIMVNGRKVESLLVNGEDFFTGSPKVAIENLPAYTVDEVKVYERMNDRDRALGYTKEEGAHSPWPWTCSSKSNSAWAGSPTWAAPTARTGTTVPACSACGLRSSRASACMPTSTTSWADLIMTRTGTGRPHRAEAWPRQRMPASTTSSTTADSASRWTATPDSGTIKTPRRARRRPPRFSTAVTCSAVRVNAAWRTNWWPMPRSTSGSRRPKRISIST